MSCTLSQRLPPLLDCRTPRIELAARPGWGAPDTAVRPDKRCCTCAGLSEIFQRPAVADLLLSCAAAAAACPLDKRKPALFASVPAAYRNGSASAAGAAPPDFDKLRDALLLLPSVADMADAASLRVRAPRNTGPSPAGWLSMGTQPGSATALACNSMRQCAAAWAAEAALATGEVPGSSSAGPVGRTTRRASPVWPNSPPHSERADCPRTCRSCWGRRATGWCAGC